MRILVVGAGAVGGYFGGMLALADRDVTFLVRPRRQKQLIEHGLTLYEPDGSSASVHPKTLTAADLAHPFDIVLIAVKSYAFDDVLDEIAPAIAAGTIIVPLLNGIAHLQKLTHRFGVDRVYGGVCFVFASLDDNGDVLRQIGPRSISWGPLSAESSPALDAISAQLVGVGFEASPSLQIMQDMWQKWVFLASIGAVTTLMRAPIGAVASAPGGFEFAKGVLAEAVAVAAAAGYRPTEAFLATTEATITEIGSSTTSSMYRDLISGRPVEADQILGDLVARAGSFGLATPLLAAASTNLNVYSTRTA